MVGLIKKVSSNRSTEINYFDRLCGARKLFYPEWKYSKTIINSFLELSYEFDGAQVNKKRYCTSFAYEFIYPKNRLDFIARDEI